MSGRMGLNPTAGDRRASQLLTLQRGRAHLQISSLGKNFVFISCGACHRPRGQHSGVGKEGPEHQAAGNKVEYTGSPRIPVVHLDPRWLDSRCQWRQLGELGWPQGGTSSSREDR